MFSSSDFLTYKIICIVFLFSQNPQLVFLTETCFALFGVETRLLNVTQTNFGFKWLKLSI